MCIYFNFWMPDVPYHLVSLFLLFFNPNSVAKRNKTRESFGISGSSLSPSLTLSLSLLAHPSYFTRETSSRKSPFRVVESFGYARIMRSRAHTHSFVSLSRLSLTLSYSLSLERSESTW